MLDENVLVLNLNPLEKNAICLSFWLSFFRNIFWWHLISGEQRNPCKVMYKHHSPDRGCSLEKGKTKAFDCASFSLEVCLASD